MGRNSQVKPAPLNSSGATRKKKMKPKDGCSSSPSAFPTQAVASPLVSNLAKRDFRICHVLSPISCFFPETASLFFCTVGPCASFLLSQQPQVLGALESGIHAQSPGTGCYPEAPSSTGHCSGTELQLSHRVSLRSRMTDESGPLLACFLFRTTEK